jgi:adenine C2-methylase RlmN of 23S rRNA A2503 and tRNA A37
MSFIRRSRGDDVLAACGQLRTESEKKSKPN